MVAGAALDLLGEVLSGLGHPLVGQGEQVEVIDGDTGAGTPTPQCSAGCCGRVDRDDPHGQAPIEGGRTASPDTLVVRPVTDAQDLSSVHIQDGCLPWFEPGPRPRYRLWEAAR